MYFGQIRPEMIEIKVFRKIKILTLLNLGGQNFLLDWIARVKVPPCAKLGSPALRVSELEGITLKNGIVPTGHNFDAIESSLTWHVYHTAVAPTLKVSSLCDLPFEDLVQPVLFCELFTRRHVAGHT